MDKAEYTILGFVAGLGIISLIMRFELGYQLSLFFVFGWSFMGAIQNRKMEVSSK